MNYQYIAGFFDGEGNICIKNRKGRQPQTVCTIVQKKSKVLYDIQKYLETGDIRSSVLMRKNGVSYLQMAHTDSVLKFLENIRPHLIVKLDECKNALKVISERDKRYRKASDGEITKIAKDREKGLSLSELATKYERDKSWLWKLFNGRTIHKI